MLGALVISSTARVSISATMRGKRSKEVSKTRASLRVSLFHSPTGAVDKLSRQCTNGLYWGIKTSKASWRSTHLVRHSSFNFLLFSPSGIKPSNTSWREGELSKNRTMLCAKSMALLASRTEQHLTTHKFSLRAECVNRALGYSCSGEPSYS